MPEGIGYENEWADDLGYKYAEVPEGVKITGAPEGQDPLVGVVLPGGTLAANAILLQRDDPAAAARLMTPFPGKMPDEPGPAAAPDEPPLGDPPPMGNSFRAMRESAARRALQSAGPPDISVIEIEAREHKDADPISQEVEEMQKERKAEKKASKGNMDKESKESQ